MPGNPSSWVNLQDYLGLNQDQGEQMGQAVYDNVTGTAQKAGTQLQQDTAGFNTAVQKGTVQAPNTDYSQVNQDKAAANAGKSYAGPTDLASFDPTLEGNVGNAIQQMQMAADPNQRGQVLQETFGSKAGGTMGDNAFDNFLTTSSAGGQRLDQFGPQFKALQDQLGLGEQNAYDTAQKAMGDSQTNAKTWGDDAAFQQGMKTVDAVRQANLKGYNAHTAMLPGASDLVSLLQGKRPSGAGWDKANDQAIQQYKQMWQPTAQAAEQGLGISEKQLYADLAKMKPQEVKDFMAMGVVPPWMTDVDASKRGRIGGFESPSMNAILQYGSDGGMWNAVTNTWKSGATTLGSAAAGGPGGIVGAGVKVAAGGGSGKGISY